ncbi:MAG: hypothetical protein AB7U73_09585 [Pirellulales bacterium]
MVADVLHRHARSLKRTRVSLSQALLVVSVVGAAGCSKEPARLATFPAAGTVAFQGKPTPGAMVVLHPEQALGSDVPRPSGYVDKEGRFVLTTFKSGDGAPAGKYKLTIEWNKLIVKGPDAEPGPNVLPAKYAQPATSDLIVEIAAGPNQLPPVKLRR